MELPKKYKKNFNHSYTLGPFPTFELLQTRPELARAVFMDDSFHEAPKLQALCKEKNIPLHTAPRALQRIGEKEATYVAGVFSKEDRPLCAQRPHIVLVNPGNMGNLGTILRTALGFGCFDVAVIEPAADLFHPKVIRASMGALFHLRCCRFPSIRAYLARFAPHLLSVLPAPSDLQDGISPRNAADWLQKNAAHKEDDPQNVSASIPLEPGDAEHPAAAGPESGNPVWEKQKSDPTAPSGPLPERFLFPFMLRNAKPLTRLPQPKPPCYSLLFGNEASGLPDAFHALGQPLYIPQSPWVDSLNLSVAAAIGLFFFSEMNPSPSNRTGQAFGGDPKP